MSATHARVGNTTRCGRLPTGTPNMPLDGVHAVPEPDWWKVTCRSCVRGMTPEQRKRPEPDRTDWSWRKEDGAKRRAEVKLYSTDVGEPGSGLPIMDDLMRIAHPMGWRWISVEVVEAGDREPTPTWAKLHELAERVASLATALAGDLLDEGEPADPFTEQDEVTASLEDYHSRVYDIESAVRNLEHEVDREFSAAEAASRANDENE